MVEPNETTESPLPGEDSRKLAKLLASTREGDQAAFDPLCGHLVAILRTWALTRVVEPSTTMPDIVSIVDATLQDNPEGMANYPRVGSCLYVLRQAVAQRIQSPNSLERTIGRSRSLLYERSLDSLEPLQREAIVLHMEMNRDFVQLVDDLGLASEDEARTLFQHSFLQLAKAVADGL